VETGRDFVLSSWAAICSCELAIASFNQCVSRRWSCFCFQHYLF
jgi:hypothetical protein